MTPGAIRQLFHARAGAAAPDRSRVLREQTSLLTKQSRAGFVSAVAASLLLGVLLVQVTGWMPFIVWFVMLIGGYALRQRLMERAQASGSLQEVLRITVIGAAALGLIVTAPAPLYFADSDVATRAFMTMFHVAWITGAVTVLGIYPPSYKIYLLCAMGSIAVGWWISGDTQRAALVTAALVAMGLLLARLADGVGRLIEESINIRHEREQLVQRLEESLAETEAAQRARSRFLASASHDLLQPVHALLLLASLARDLPEGPRRDDALRQLNTTAEAIDAMFRGLLDLARFDAGTMQPQLTAMPVAHVLRSVQAAYQSRCADKGVLLTVEMPPGVHVHADPSMFDRVVRNLVDNAVKFTPRGEIAVRCRREGDMVAIEVQDSGVGIAADDLAHVQEAFFRGASAREAQADGVGLGLANSTQMARLQHGDIRLRSTPGVGTVATFTLPAATPVLHTDGGAKPMRSLRYRAIVLVEDDRAARTATELWLREHGASVVAAADLETALEGCERLPLVPDYLLCDYHLGGGRTGVQALLALRERFGALPAAIISGEALTAADLPPGVPLLAKPLRPERLLELLA